jgi:hypothetical protein
MTRRRFATLIHEKRNIDLAFILLHGSMVRTGACKAFRIFGNPFLGSGFLRAPWPNRDGQGQVQSVGLKVVEDVVLQRSYLFGRVIQKSSGHPQWSSLFRRIEPGRLHMSLEDDLAGGSRLRSNWMERFLSRNMSKAER